MVSRDWYLVPALIEGRPGVRVHDSEAPAGPALYFILLEWAEERVIGMRDFRYARYVMDGAEFADLHPAANAL